MNFWDKQISTMLEQEQKMQSINKHSFKHLQFTRFKLMIPNKQCYWSEQLRFIFDFLLQFRWPSALENCHFKFSVDLEVHRKWLIISWNCSFNHQTFPTLKSGSLSKNIGFERVFLLLPTWQDMIFTSPLHHNLAFLALTKRVTSRHSNRSRVAQALHVHHKCSVYCVSCSIACFFQIQHY